MANELTDLAAAPRAESGSPSALQLAQVGWRHRYLILLGTLLGLTIGAMYHARQVTVYQSSAQVLVIKKRSEEITGIKQLSIEDYMATHQVLIRSPWVVNKTIEKGRLKSLQMFAGLDRAGVAQTLMSGLRVQGAEGGANILEVAYRGDTAEECGQVVDAILESYKEFLDETYANVSDETVKIITQMRDILEKDLKTKETDYRVFRETNPVFLRVEEGKDEHHEMLASLQAKKSALALRKIELQSQLKAIEAGRQEGRSNEALVTLIAEYAGKAEERDETARKPVDASPDGLFPLLIEEQRLAETYGTQHPELVEIRKRIAFTRNYFARQFTFPLETSPKEAVSGKPTEQVAAYVERVKERLHQITLSEQFYNDLIEKQRAVTGKLIRFEIEDENYRKEIARLQQFYEGLVKRLHEVGLAQQTQPGGYDARIISPPGLGVKVAPRATPIFLASALLGIMAGMGMAYLVEATDRRFRSLDEVRQRLGLPVVGCIPLLAPGDSAVEPNGDGEPSGLSPVLITHHRSRSMEAEAYRGVRTALYFSMGDRGHKVVQVTSPNPGDGKTTVATNLAVSIAQSGKRTLLIDADLRRPTVHRVLGLPSEVGLSSVIADRSDPEAAVQDSGIPNLSVLLTGPIPPNPAELLTSTRFKDLLDFFRDRYDFVIVDTPPLLAVTDPCVVAPRVDGVLLVVRIVNQGRPLAERAREILASLGVHVFGVIVNAVEDKQITGYGYGYYNYRYGRYGYGRYGYADEQGQPAPQPASDRKTMGPGTKIAKPR